MIQKYSDALLKSIRSWRARLQDGPNGCHGLPNSQESPLGGSGPQGIAVKAAAVAADKDEVTITLSATKQAPVGLRENIIVTGTLRAGKETVTGMAPAIPIQVVAASR